MLSNTLACRGLAKGMGSRVRLPGPGFVYPIPRPIYHGNIPPLVGNHQAVRYLHAGIAARKRDGELSSGHRRKKLRRWWLKDTSHIPTQSKTYERATASGTA